MSLEGFKVPGFGPCCCVTVYPIDLCGEAEGEGASEPRCVNKLKGYFKVSPMKDGICLGHKYMRVQCCGQGHFAGGQKEKLCFRSLRMIRDMINSCYQLPPCRILIHAEKFEASLLRIAHAMTFR